MASVEVAVQERRRVSRGDVGHETFDSVYDVVCRGLGIIEMPWFYMSLKDDQNLWVAMTNFQAGTMVGNRWS